MADFQQNTTTNRQALLDYIDTNSGGGGGSQNLSDVLNTGNSSGANDIVFDASQGLSFNNGSLFREGTTDAGLGGGKGVAQICSIGYELKWEAGRLYVMEQGGVLIRHSLYNFNNTPGSNDDDTKGYVVGSIWSLDNGEIYECSDATTGNAVWTQVTAQLDYTEYVAYITQDTPPSPPIANVVKNNTGAIFSFQYLDVGEYNIVATGAFPYSEKVVPSFNGQGVRGFTKISFNNSSTLSVSCVDISILPSDLVFEGNLTIRIYN